MTTRKRKTIPKGVTVHVFQRARHGFVVFYNSKDSFGVSHNLLHFGGTSQSVRAWTVRDAQPYSHPDGG